MNSTRSSFGAAVVDNRIFVVGGWVNSGRSTSVESLLFQQQPQDKDKDHTNSNSNVSCTFPNSLWRGGTTPDSFQPPRFSCRGQGGIMSCCCRRLLQQSWKVDIYLSGSVGYPTDHCLESSQFDHSVTKWLLHGLLV